MSRLAFFLSSTGTDAGKTYVGEQLCRAAIAIGWSVTPSKPVMSGFAPGELAESDAGRLADAAGLQFDDIERISPWRYRADLAPAHAADTEGASLDYREVRDYCLDRLNIDSDLQLVEGAGGIMSPIAHGRLNLHLAVDLDLPVILVVPAYLGAVSHALSAIEVIRARGLELAALVVNDRNADADLAEMIRSDIAYFAPDLRLIAFRHMDCGAGAAATLAVLV